MTGSGTAAAERYTKARQELAAVAPEKPAGELQTGDLVNTGTLQSQHWAEVRGVHVHEATGDVILRLADDRTLHVPADRATSVLRLHKGEVDAARHDAAVAADALAAAADDLVRWDRQVEDVERQRDGLFGRRPAAQRVDKDPERAEQPSYLARTLGPLPQDTAARQIWHAAADAIETYRDRWSITRTDCALGRQPIDPEQRDDRDATVATLRGLTVRLAEVGRERHDRRDQTLAAEQERMGRGPFAATIPGGQS